MAAGRNLELKTRDRDPARSLAVCGEIGAKSKGTLSQIDTYFVVPRGRLKLREQAPNLSAYLIAYERADDQGSKESLYRIVPVPDAPKLKDALAAALGIRVTVRKERRLFLWEGVRIHLDEVDALGSFIEFEGVATADTEAANFEPLLDGLRRSFAIRDEDLVGLSYSDLLEEVWREARSMTD